MSVGPQLLQGRNQITLDCGPEGEEEDGLSGHKGSQTLDKELFSVRLSVARQRRISLSLVGELDMASAPLLGAVVKSLVDEDVRSVVVDAREVEFCDAAGLHALLAGHRSTHRIGNTFAIVPSPPIQRLTALLQLDEELSLFSTLSAALAATKGA